MTRLVFALAGLLTVLSFSSCDSGSVDGGADPPGEDNAPAVGCGDARAITLQVPPTATYLRVAPGDEAAPAPAYRLSSLGDGLEPGSRVRVERLGEYQFRDIHPDSVRYGVLAVFSADDTLLDRDERERVPGAIDAGSDFVSRPSHVGGGLTDIAEDFAVFEADTLVVPQGAAYVFVSPDDDAFDDNLDEDEDFRLCITPVEG